MTTVTAVRLAIVETMDHPDVRALGQTSKALSMVATSPTALTILANRLSDMGTAGNAARDRNLALLRDIGIAHNADQAEQRKALEWAIDQLTPPEPAQKIAGMKVVVDPTMAPGEIKMLVPGRGQHVQQMGRTRRDPLAHLPITPKTER